MEHRRYAGCVALLLIGIHLTGAENGTSVVPVDTECKPGKLTKSWTNYVKEKENVNFKLCADEYDGKLCLFEKGDVNYCFIYKDNKSQPCSNDNPDAYVAGEVLEDKYCKITIANMTDTLKGEWTLRMGRKKAKVDLKLEENFSNIAITLGSETVILDQPVDVTCKVSGGVPEVNASDITFMLMDNNNKTVDGSVERFTKNSTDKTADGKDVQVTRSFTPKREDQSLRPCCKVQQKDVGKVLYSANKMTKPLDVKFGPKQSSDPKYSENNSVTITIESNPKWTTWNLTATTVCHGDNMPCTDSFLNSTNYEKEKEDHILVEFKKVADSDFKYEFTIKALKIEHMANTTVALNIFNQIGEPLKIEAFPLVSDGSDKTTQKPGDNSSDATPNPSNVSTAQPPEERGLSGGAVAAIVIFVILGIGAGVYFYRKRMGSGSERMPLSGTSMSSLGSR